MTTKRWNALGAMACLGASLGLGAAGCGGLPQEDEGTGGGSSESIATDEAPFTQCTCNINNIKEYSVETPLQTFTGPSTNDNICWLSAIDGYSSSSTSLNGRVYQSNGSWRMTGANSTMTCVPKCCFHSNGGTLDQQMVSSEFVATAVSNVGEANKTGTTSMWLSDAMPILSGMVYGRAGGMMGTFGEGSKASLATQPTQAATLTAIAHSNGVQAYTYSYGYSFFTGIPYNAGSTRPAHVVKMKDYGIMLESSKVLISTSAGICTLGQIFNFTAPNSFAYVHADGGLWKAGRSNASVRPVCYYFAQDQ